MPWLRFPEFHPSVEWKVTTLNSLAVKIIDKNKDCSITRVLTNSATDGVVNQSEYFERKIVTQSNIDNYFVIDKGDYVYNPRISTSAPVGPISKNKIGKGIMSPLYTVFRFNNPRNEFYEQYFKTNLWNSYLKIVSNTGARHDRISISTENFMKMPLPYSSYEEQQKIAECLSYLDDLITAEDKKLSALKMHKKGLMQRLFPTEGKTVPEWRFPEFRGCGEWEERKLSQVTSYVDYRGKTPKKSNLGIFLLTAKNIKMGYLDYRCSQEYIPENTYNVVMSRGVPQVGDVLITTEAPCGNVAQIENENVALAQRIIKYRGVEGKLDNTYLKYVLLSPKFQYNLSSKSTGGIVKGIKGSVLHELPIDFTSLNEQKQIADCLSSLDVCITAQVENIEALKAHKKGLMQGLFPSIEEVGE
ncbi:type I restriction enzyme S subunit [Aureibacillus halotolerans]|uniref:Type I restriction enzyme S subunit n=1 Tax=Aureibacillus halotolerans TaxID=1508390 RepID=A0A4R6TQR8_9BACI|nr:type I restriction enzyme S subunit [Aureibacillus halotolerans]